MTNDELKKQYEKKTISEIEGSIKENNQLSLEARRDAIFALAYLEHSGRYKENPMYRKSNFENYLKGFYNIRINTYMESKRSFMKHEAETIKYGVGLVSKIYRQCGALKEQKVLDDIHATEKGLKAPIKRDKIDAIIQKYAKPTPPAKPGYKTLYINEMKQHQITKGLYKETLLELKEAMARIEKLKETIFKLRQYDAQLPMVTTKHHEKRVIA